MMLFNLFINDILLDVVDIQAVAQDFLCLNDSSRKQYMDVFQSSRP